jgi:hypothetical protein
MRELNPKQLRYVQRRVLGDNCADAARAAGYSKQYANRASDRVERQNPKIREAIDAARERIRQETVYDGEKLIAETKAMVDFAREHKNPMAAIKGLELIAKLTGLLIERHQVETINLVDIRAELERRRQFAFGGRVQVSDIPAAETAAITGPAPPPADY